MTKTARTPARTVSNPSLLNETPNDKRESAIIVEEENRKCQNAQDEDPSPSTLSSDSSHESDTVYVRENRVSGEFELEDERMKLTSKETRESTCESSGTEEEGYTGLRDVSRVP